MWVENKEPYVFPKTLQPSVFYPNVLDGDWWFILRHDLISKHLFEKNDVTMSSEEDNHGDGNGD
jgi:hypothetical protein